MSGLKEIESHGTSTQVERKSSSEFVETLKDVTASFVGSAACVYSGQPFDTVKVRLQVQPGEFTSALDCFRKTMWGEGVTKLWSGSVPALTGALLENAVAFGVNGALKRILSLGDKAAPRLEKDKSFVEPFLTGGITGFFTAIVLCPCDVLKCRAQLSRATGQDARIREVVRRLVEKSGVRGFYTGFSAQVIRDIPFYGSFFGTYDVMCRVLKDRTNWSDASVYFTAGGIAGQVGWVVSIAPDVIKSRIQTSEVPLKFMQTFRTIIAQNGYRGLFAGIEVAIVRAFPANAALFVGFELTKKVLSDSFD